VSKLSAHRRSIESNEHIRAESIKAMCIDANRNSGERHAAERISGISGEHNEADDIAPKRIEDERNAAETSKPSASKPSV
jgi:hypothetical protein